MQNAITISVVGDLLPDVIRQLEKPEPVYRMWAVYLDAISVKAFKNEQSPAGSPWAALNPKYLAQRSKARGERREGIKKGPKPMLARYGDKILRVTGRLYDSLAAQVAADGVTIGTNVMVGQYSLGAIHQYGAPRANIPARPFLPFTGNSTQIELLPQVQAKLQTIVQEWIAKL